MSLRDQCWTTALEQIVRTGKFKIGDLPFKESERHTCRRVLREMESYSWLSRDNPNAAIWRAGPKAELLMNLSAETLENARS
jgi:hypothetical protein